MNAKNPIKSSSADSSAESANLARLVRRAALYRPPPPNWQAGSALIQDKSGSQILERGKVLFVAVKP